MMTSNVANSLPSGFFSNSFYTQKYPSNYTVPDYTTDYKKTWQLNDLSYPQQKELNTNSVDQSFYSSDSVYDNSTYSSNESSTVTTPPATFPTTFSFKPTAAEKTELHNQLQNNKYNSSSSIVNKTSKVSKSTKPSKMDYKKHTRSTNRQPEISSTTYVSADPSIDISEFTEEDVIVLKNLLSAAEIHKWKYVSNKLSKIRSKKLSAEYCINKFHTMYNLPFNPKNTLLNSNYFLKLDDKEQKEETFEGMLGSSIPYIVSKDGWNSIDP